MLFALCFFLFDGLSLNMVLLAIVILTVFNVILPVTNVEIGRELRPMLHAPKIGGWTLSLYPFVTWLVVAYTNRNGIWMLKTDSR